MLISRDKEMFRFSQHPYVQYMIIAVFIAHLVPSGNLKRMNGIITTAPDECLLHKLYIAVHISLSQKDTTGARPIYIIGGRTPV